MNRPKSDIAFTARVKEEQQRRGSRAQYKRMGETKGWPDRVTSDLAAVIASVRSFYLGTANAECHSPTSSIGADPRAFFASSTTRHVALPTTAVTGNTSRSAI